MAGHSKWANIQHRKGKQDAKRGKLFTKLIREITVSAKLGGGDPDANPRLRSAIDTALSGNMTRETIERAVKRGAGDLETTNIEEIRYEGYGPGGTAVIVDCMTDNKNRTVAEVRHAFSKYGGNLGTDGSVAYLFQKCGLISLPSGADEDTIIAIAIDAGAEDVISNNDGSFDIITDSEDFIPVKSVIIAAKLVPESAAITMRASTSSELDLDKAKSMIGLIDMLEDLDDVQNVYSNAEIPDDILAELN
ncbi:MAG: YebC/PmpR family DNA-binding regulatory protein [Gammaproteobacteria bacterium]|jgi:YebC/PmpR family DNA-binding regulatory protein